MRTLLRVQRYKMLALVLPVAARRLHQGHFVWPQASSASASDGVNRVSLSRAQLDALVLGLPWSRIGEAGVITVV